MALYKRFHSVNALPIVWPCAIKCWVQNLLCACCRKIIAATNVPHTRMANAVPSTSSLLNISAATMSPLAGEMTFTLPNKNKQTNKTQMETNCQSEERKMSKFPSNNTFDLETLLQYSKLWGIEYEKCAI